MNQGSTSFYLFLHIPKTHFSHVGYNWISWNSLTSLTSSLNVLERKMTLLLLTAMISPWIHEWDIKFFQSNIFGESNLCFADFMVFPYWPRANCRCTDKRIDHLCLDNSISGLDNSISGLDNSISGLDNSSSCLYSFYSFLDNSISCLDHLISCLDNSLTYLENSISWLDNSFPV